MRHPQLLMPDACHVVVIDMQAKLLAAMSSPEELVRRAANFVAAGRIMGIPTTITQHYTRGLGPTDSRILGVAGECPIIEKIDFCACGCMDFLDRIRQVNRRQLILLGLEAHICMAQTAMDLHHHGYEVHVLADACGSRRPFDHETAMHRLRQAGVIVTTTEAAAYELMTKAGTELFKSVLPLFK